jgi:hypothetical protein
VVMTITMTRTPNEHPPPTLYTLERLARTAFWYADRWSICPTQHFRIAMSEGG